MPKKKIIIRACEDCNCVDRGALEVIKTIEDSTGVAIGEQNSRYDFDRSACLGGCDFGPNILVNSEIVLGVKPNTVMAEIAKVADATPLTMLAKQAKLNQQIEEELDSL